MRSTLVPVVAIALSLLPLSAAAIDRYVNPHATCPVGGLPQHATIQEAVDSADPGDQIGVCPGTYQEIVTVPETKIGISITGLGRVIVEPEPASFPDFVLTVLADDVVVEKLEIRELGSGQAGQTILLYVAASGATIRNNRLVGGHTALHIGGGDGHRVHGNVISAGENGLVLGGIRGAEVFGNRVFGLGTGISVWGVALSPIVVHHNVASALETAMHVGADGMTVRNNTALNDVLVSGTGFAFVHNVVRGSLNALVVASSTDCLVGFNTISAPHFGIALLDISGCVIQRNNVLRSVNLACAWDGRNANVFRDNTCGTESPPGAWD